MSRYVKHKHGMTIGSDNIFFVHDRADPRNGKPGPPEGVPDFRDMYRAIVSFDSIYCTQINTLNAGLRTPAHQIVWEEEFTEVPRSYTSKENGKTTTWIEHQKFWVVNPWIQGWLNKHVGAKYDKWDTYTYCQRNDPCLFFRRRKDALAFVRYVQQNLVGMRVGLH